MKHFLLALLLILTAACAIDADDWSQCQEACAPNGGTRKATWDVFNGLRCVCDNGAFFDEYSWARRKKKESTQ
jgi:hypothetical protein